MSPHTATIQRLAAEILRLESELVAPDADLAMSLAFDSLDHVELIMAIETEYGISLEDSDCETFRTVNDFAGHLDRLGIPAPSAH